jgi:hypothetical protein
MTPPKNKEYTPPTAARCKEDAERISREVETFLNKGGTIKKIDSDLEVTDAHRKTKTKRDTARKRGMKKMVAA